MLAIPRMEVLVPGHAREVDALLRATYARPTRPICARSVATNAQSRSTSRPAGSRSCGSGGGPTVLAFGPMLDPRARGQRRTGCHGCLRDEPRPVRHAGPATAAGETPRVIAVEPFYEGTSAPVLVETFRGVPAALTFVVCPERSSTDTAHRSTSMGMSVSMRAGFAGGSSNAHMSDKHCRHA